MSGHHHTTKASLNLPPSPTTSTPFTPSTPHSPSLSTSTASTAPPISPISPTTTTTTTTTSNSNSNRVLHLTLPAIHSISGPEGLSSLWHVFSKCKSSLEDGERLENISWRLWAQACADRVGGSGGGGKEVRGLRDGEDVENEGMGGGGGGGRSWKGKGKEIYTKTRNKALDHHNPHRRASTSDSEWEDSDILDGTGGSSSLSSSASESNSTGIQPPTSTPYSTSSSGFQGNEDGLGQGPGGGRVGNGEGNGRRRVSEEVGDEDEDEEEEEEDGSSGFETTSSSPSDSDQEVDLDLETNHRPSDPTTNTRSSLRGASPTMATTVSNNTIIRTPVSSGSGIRPGIRRRGTSDEDARVKGDGRKSAGDAIVERERKISFQEDEEEVNAGNVMERRRSASGSRSLGAAGKRTGPSPTPSSNSNSTSRGRKASPSTTTSTRKSKSSTSRSPVTTTSVSRPAPVPNRSSTNSTTIPPSSTPKASSYPTPSQSIRPSHTFLRSHSHLPHPSDTALPSDALASAAQEAERQQRLQMFSIAKARRANRPFGEVLKDVFRVPSVNEVMEACNASHQLAVSQQAGGISAVDGEELKRKISVGGLGSSLSLGTAPGAAVGVAAVQGEEEEEDKRMAVMNSPAMPSVISTSLTSAPETATETPELRLVEPTPVPSRVGSLNNGSPGMGRFSPLARHDAATSLHASPAQLARMPSNTAISGYGTGLMPMTRMASTSSTQRSSSPVFSPQEEKSDPIASLHVGPPRRTSSEDTRSSSPGPSSLRKPSSMTHRRSSGSSASRPHVQIAPEALSAAQKKKDKKSMFYIQSPGDRYGSVSGSETSQSSNTSGMSNQLSRPSKLSGSPLATNKLDVVVKTAPSPVSPPPNTRNNTTETPTAVQSPEESLTRVPSRRMSSVSVASAGRHHSGGPPTHHRKVSDDSTKHGHKSHAGRATAGHAGPKRTGSAAQMAGKFQGEKARAAAAIAARLQAQQESERLKQAEQRRQHLSLAKRQQSAPNLEQIRRNAELQDAEVVNGSAEDDEDWSSETDETANEAEDALMFGKNKGKGKARNIPMDLARAADEAQRQRELFAKRAIFGSNGESRPQVSGLSGVSGGSRPGLLSNLFETQRDVIRRGDSMVNLQNAMASTDHVPGRHQSHGLSSNFPLNRSKSVVAMPQTSGISVGRSGFVAPPQVMAESPKAVIQQPAPRGKLRLPAGPAALSAEDMSPSSSPDNESSLLATSAAVKRLEALSARRSSKTPVSPQPQQKTSPDLSRGQQTQQQYPTSQPLQRVQSNPIPAQFNTMHGQAFAEPSMPQTPTTRRRQMLATELPEDLRLNLLWERRSRAPLYPNKRNTGLKSSQSAHDLPATNNVQRELPEDGTPDIRRQHSDQTTQTPSAQAQQHQQTTQVQLQQPHRSSYDPQSNVQRRKPGPNLLSGGNLLRPMTSLSKMPEPERPTSAAGGRGVGGSTGGGQPAPSASRSGLAQRSMSVANMEDYQQQQQQEQRDAAALAQQRAGAYSTTAEGSNLKRRMTDGMAGQAVEEGKRVKSLREREEEFSSSFRSHGW